MDTRTQAQRQKDYEDFEKRVLQHGAVRPYNFYGSASQKALARGESPFSNAAPDMAKNAWNAFARAYGAPESSFMELTSGGYGAFTPPGTQASPANAAPSYPTSGPGSTMPAQVNSAQAAQGSGNDMETSSAIATLAQNLSAALAGLNPQNAGVQTGATVKDTAQSYVLNGDPAGAKVYLQRAVATGEMTAEQAYQVGREIGIY